MAVTDNAGNTTENVQLEPQLLFRWIRHSFGGVIFKQHGKSTWGIGIVQLEQVGTRMGDQRPYLGWSEVVSEFPCQLFLQTGQIGKKLSVRESWMLKSLCQCCSHLGVVKFSIGNIESSQAFPCGTTYLQDSLPPPCNFTGFAAFMPSGRFITKVARNFSSMCKRIIR